MQCVARKARHSISSRTANRAQCRIASQRLLRQPRHPTHPRPRYIIQGALQASDRAGSRQVKDANVSLVGASASMKSTTFIFVGEPRLRPKRSRPRRGQWAWEQHRVQPSA